ncbi:MAG: hypothetical protein ACXQS2_00335 [Methermicoccaceae archaeon]
MRVVDAEIHNIIEDTGQILVRVVLEDDDGHVEDFAIDFWEMLDPDKFAKILHNWKTDILPKRKKVHNLVKVKRDIQTIQDFITALKDIRVESTDTPDAVKKKILQKVQNILNKIERE